MNDEQKTSEAAPTVRPRAGLFSWGFVGLALAHFFALPERDAHRNISLFSEFSKCLRDSRLLIQRPPRSVQRFFGYEHLEATGLTPARESVHSRCGGTWP